MIKILIIIIFIFIVPFKTVTQCFTKYNTIKYRCNLSIQISEMREEMEIANFFLKIKKRFDYINKSINHYLFIFKYNRNL